MRDDNKETKADEGHTGTRQTPLDTGKCDLLSGTARPCTLRSRDLLHDSIHGTECEMTNEVDLLQGNSAVSDLTDRGQPMYKEKCVQVAAHALTHSHP